MITFASGCGERRARLQLAAGAAGHDEAGAGPGEQQLHRPRALGELAAGVPQLGRALGRLSGLRARYLHREVIHQNIEGKMDILYVIQGQINVHILHRSFPLLFSNSKFHKFCLKMKHHN